MKTKKWPKRIPTWRQLWERATRGMPEWKLRYGCKPKTKVYEAIGGPLHGKWLSLVDGDTAPLRFRDGTCGRYFCGMVAGREGPGTTVWRAVQ